jgi:hypothetical protein
MSMSHLRRIVLILVWVPTLLAQGQPPSNQPPSSRIWIGRHQEIEDYLRTAECIRMELLGPNHAARCTLRPGGPAARMAWKPLPPGLHRGFRESYKAEIAAYEFDKLLSTEMVPPTVERELEGSVGAAQLWVENIYSIKADEGPTETHRASWEIQLARMTMFDNLIGNRDRNRANMLRDGAWSLILIDHSRAFGIETALYQKMNVIDPAYWAQIERLTRQQLDGALRAWLDPNEVSAILDRREKMRADLKPRMK